MLAGHPVSPRSPRLRPPGRRDHGLPGRLRGSTPTRPANGRAIAARRTRTTGPFPRATGPRDDAPSRTPRFVPLAGPDPSALLTTGLPVTGFRPRSRGLQVQSHHGSHAVADPDPQTQEELRALRPQAGRLDHAGSFGMGWRDPDPKVTPRIDDTGAPAHHQPCFT